MEEDWSYSSGLYHYHRKINNPNQRKVWLTYIFYKLNKEVINLVTLLKKNDRKKGHADVSHEIEDGGLFTLAIT